MEGDIRVAARRQLRTRAGGRAGGRAAGGAGQQTEVCRGQEWSAPGRQRHVLTFVVAGLRKKRQHVKQTVQGRAGPHCLRHAPANQLWWQQHCGPCVELATRRAAQAMMRQPLGADRRAAGLICHCCHARTARIASKSHPCLASSRAWRSPEQRCCLLGSIAAGAPLLRPALVAARPHACMPAAPPLQLAATSRKGRPGERARPLALHCEGSSCSAVVTCTHQVEVLAPPGSQAPETTDSYLGTPPRSAQKVRRGVTPSFT